MKEPLLVKLRNRLGFNAAEVAAAGGWSRQAFRALEQSTELSLEDGLAPSTLYGLDLARILEAGRIRAWTSRSRPC